MEWNLCQGDANPDTVWAAQRIATRQRASWPEARSPLRPAEPPEANDTDTSPGAEVHHALAHSEADVQKFAFIGHLLLATVGRLSRPRGGLIADLDRRPPRAMPPMPRRRCTPVERRSAEEAVSLIIQIIDNDSQGTRVNQTIGILVQRNTGEGSGHTLGGFRGRNQAVRMHPTPSAVNEGSEMPGSLE
jgi:hypothetical protein